jgi:hypothetical protein
MKKPPDQLDGANVLVYCPLDERIRPTGRHSITLEDGAVFVPSYVAICQYENEDIFYRFYCDSEWKIITDMDYPSLEEAIEEVEEGYQGAALLLRDGIDD